MATETALVDDFDGSKEDVATVAFSYMADDYEIDLSKDNRDVLAALQGNLRSYVSVARKLPRRSGYSRLTASEKLAIRADLKRAPHTLISDDEVETWQRQHAERRPVPESVPATQSPAVK